MGIQVALALVLLVSSGLMLRSFLTMYRMDIGIQTARLVTTGMIIPARKYPGWEDRTRFLQAIDDRFASVAIGRGAQRDSGGNRISNGTGEIQRRRAHLRASIGSYFAAAAAGTNAKCF